MSQSAHAHKPAGQRPLRVGEEIRHVLSRIIERGELRNPVLSQQMITVTEVKVSPDLRNATVYIVPLGGGDPAPVLDALSQAKGFLRHTLSTQVRMRSVPTLFFEADTSFDTAGHINDLLHRPDVRRDLDKPAATEE